MQKSLDLKLRSIHADPQGSKEFIIADAKDADMAFGLGAPGRSPERHDGELLFKSLADYRQQIRDVIRQGVVDIVLMSASTSEVLCLNERLFDNSPVTPAAFGLSISVRRNHSRRRLAFLLRGRMIRIRSRRR